MIRNHNRFNTGIILLAIGYLIMTNTEHWRLLPWTLFVGIFLFVVGLIVINFAIE